MSDIYDLAILGGGPGGYVAAERAGAHGLKIAVIEKAHLGGVCLNEGCIPSKTLLYSSKIFKTAQNAATYGVSVGDVSFDLSVAMKRKNSVIQKLRGGIGFLMKSNKADVYNGWGRFNGPNKLAISAEDGSEQEIEARNILITTGSAPIRIPIPGHDLPHVVTSTEMLQIEKLPKNAVVMGGGVIGMEFASFLSNVGVNVTVVEMLPEIVPGIEPELAAMLRKAISKATYRLNTKATEITPDAVKVETADGVEEIPADLVLMSVGRRPNVEGNGFETIGLDFDRGGIAIDDHMRTNVPGVYAAGDVTGKAALAHTASRMGEVAVNHIIGRADVMRYGAIPWVVYTDPEVAGVGETEESLTAEGTPFEVASFPMTANGRFLAENENGKGICKVLIEKESRVLRGVHMIGSHCSEMIFGAAAMLETELRVRDIRDIVFPHPTVSEVFREAMFHLSE